MKFQQICLPALFTLATCTHLALGFVAPLKPTGFTTKPLPRSQLSMVAEENSGKKEIKVGVIGCGRIGIVHLGAITKAPNVKPIIVSNPTVSKAEAGKIIMKSKMFKVEFQYKLIMPQ